MRILKDQPLFVGDGAGLAEILQLPQVSQATLVQL